jgi:hypothetical protein
MNFFRRAVAQDRLQKASLRGADLSFRYAAGESFRGSDMREYALYKAEVGLHSRHAAADFTDTLVTTPRICRKSKCWANLDCDWA